MTARTEKRSSRVDEGIGESAPRPDGIAKLKGEFEYAQDQWVEGCCGARPPEAHTPMPGYSRSMLLRPSPSAGSMLS